MPVQQILNIIIGVLVILLLFHLLGGVAIPTWRASTIYYPGLGTLVLLVILLYVLGRLP